MLAPWTFAAPPTTPRRPHVLLIAFSAGPLAPARPADPTAPGAAFAAAAELRTIEARTDPAWVAGWRAGSLRAIAEADLAGDLAALDAADRVHLIALAPDAPADLSYLQAAWALARDHAARGATTILDVHAMTYWRATAVPAADAALDLARELRVVFESSRERPGGAHALHTRGLRKLGVPDVVALCGADDVDVVRPAITAIAAALARGGELGAGPTPIPITAAQTWQLAADRDGLADLLQLHNEARVLVDASGNHLLGVAERLRAARS